MKCQRCNNEVQDSKEMCTFCGAPIAPIPIPSGGKVRFGEYDWFVLLSLLFLNRQGLSCGAAYLK